MSRITEKSPKDCAAKQSPLNPHNFNKRLFFYLSSLSLTLLLSFIFLVWLILRPSKPEFSITQAHINQLNLTRPSILNSSIQLTILSNNPNKKSGIYYNEIYAYASYKGLKITTETLISPFYQDPEHTDILSACLVGYQHVVGPSLGYQVQSDQIRAGRLELDFKIFGKLTWKVGNWKFGKYRFNVDCVTLIIMPFGATFSTNLSYVQATGCSTTL